jgi:integrase/recombinase XerD
MPTATAILNTKYKGKDDTYPIVIRLIDGTNQKLHPVKYRVEERFWECGQVSEKHPEADIINSIIDEELLAAKRYFRDCRIAGTQIDLELVFKTVKSHSFTAYLTHRAKQHAQADQVEMKTKLTRYVKEFELCFGKEVLFSDVTQDFLRTYDSFLIALPNVPNTRAKKFEFLGKYFGNAISEKKHYGDNPFKSYRFTLTPAKKEKLTTDQIRALENLHLTNDTLIFARDLFLFSYYCKGIRFETCLTMKKSSVRASRLYFQNQQGQKTNVCLNSR